jgi:O-antigen/teichoic acid export membrane protein
MKTEESTGSPALAAKHSPVVSRTIRNVVANWGGFAFSILVTFFLSPFVVRHLGNGAYGVWVLIGSLTGYLGLLDMGVRGAVTRYVAKFHAQADHRQANETASSAMMIFSSAGLLAILISAGLGTVALNRLHIPEGFQEQARVVLVIAGVTVAVSLVGGVFGGILVALQRFDLVNIIEIITSGLRAIAIVFALRRGAGITALALFQLAGGFLSALASAILVAKLYPELRIRFNFANRPHLRMIFSFSVYSFLLQVFSYLILYTDSVVIAAFLPVNFVTFFAIAGNLIAYARGLTRGISSTVTPLASQMEAAGDFAGLRRTALTSACYSTALMMPIGLTFLLRGSSFISLWMGTEYATLSGGVLWILAWMAIFSTGPGAGWAVMQGIGKHQLLVPVYLLEALANLVMSIVLVRTMGIFGVAWGSTIPNLIVCFLFWPWYMRRTLQIPVRQYVASTWGWPLLAMVPFALGTYLIERIFPASNLLLFFSQVAATLPLALAGFWYVCVPREERQARYQQVKQAMFART